MSKPVIFTISAAWGSGGIGVERALRRYSGRCRRADARRASGKISAMALDLLPDNHPDVAPESLFLQTCV
jgi:hypothetical protein